MESQMKTLIASLALLLALAAAGLAFGVAGIDFHDLARAIDHSPAVAIINAWPKKYEGIG